MRQTHCSAVVVTLGLWLAGCATTPRGARPASDCSRYAVGDFVVYRTTQRRNGIQETFHLLERVDSKQCRRIVIHDWLVSAHAGREWRMALTDTPENQRNNIADAVWKRTAAGWVRVEIAAIRELFATGVDVDGQTARVSNQRANCPVAGRTFPCTVKITRGTVAQVPVTVTCSRSKQFLWTNIGCDFRSLTDGRLVFRQEVVDFGRVRAGELPARWRGLLQPR